MHCVGMCGGIVAAMSMGKKESWWKGMVIYHLGRIFTYSIIGLAAGALGLMFTGGSSISYARNMLSVIAGFFMVIFALQIGGIIPERYLSLSFIRIPAALLRKTSQGNSIFLWGITGLVNGLLPCGMVYAVLSLALKQADAFQGMIIMASFGLGTVPAMTGMAIIIRKWSPASRGIFLKWMAFALVIFGFMTMARGYIAGTGHDHHLSSVQSIAADDAACAIEEK